MKAVAVGIARQGDVAQLREALCAPLYLRAAEIQEITGVSAGAIATRLTRIRQRLTESIRAGGRPQ